MAPQGGVDPALSVTRHDSALGSWEHAWQRPGRALRHLVAGYTGYQQRLAAPAVHRGIPGPTVPLVISFGRPQTITAAQPGHPPVTVDSFLAGLHDRHVLIQAEAYHGIQVDLRPLAAYRLLAQPLEELTGQVVGLDVLFGPDAERLTDDLACARDWPTRFRRLDRFLLQRLAGGALPAPEVARAWQLIVSSVGASASANSPPSADGASAISRPGSPTWWACPPSGWPALCASTTPPHCCPGPPREDWQASRQPPATTTSPTSPTTSAPSRG
ncbi:MAG TPA: DUF6597 domain-containing transcriptional factor [Egibacteraceae bacterium]|nr:DUF6597 domain-containing transcriptional factor [Egibacteraceae bacterium]